MYHEHLFCDVDYILYKYSPIFKVKETWGHCNLIFDVGRFMVFNTTLNNVVIHQPASNIRWQFSQVSLVLNIGEYL